MSEYVFRVERERLTFGDLHQRQTLLQQINEAPAPLDGLLAFFARFAVDPATQEVLSPEQARAAIYEIPFETVVPTFYKLCKAISEVMLPPENGKP